MDDEEKKLSEKELEKQRKAEQKAREEREKQFKKDGCRTGAEFKRIQASLDAIETGIFGLDMGIGYYGPNRLCGLRQRDVMEVCGESGNGKTAIIDQVMLTTIKRYGPESVFALFSEPPEIERMERKGINLDDFTMRCCFDPDIDYKKNLAEQHLETALVKAENPKTKVVIIDSIAALCAASQLFDGAIRDDNFRDMDVTPVAALAKIFNNFILQWNMRNKSNSVLIMTNHYKVPINTMIGNTASTIQTPGGRGKEFLSWVRVLVRGRLKASDPNDNKHSIEDTRQCDILSGSFELFKNKYAHADNNRVVKWTLDLATGLYNNEEKLLDWASLFGKRIEDPKGKGNKITVSELDPPVASSGWTYIGDEKFQAKDAAVQYLRDNPDIYEKLKLQMFARSARFFKDEAATFDLEQLLDG